MPSHTVKENVQKIAESFLEKAAKSRRDLDFEWTCHYILDWKNITTHALN